MEACRTVRGEALDGLRDTYSSERHPVGAQVLDRSRAWPRSCGQARACLRSKPSFAI